MSAPNIIYPPSSGGGGGGISGSGTAGYLAQFTGSTAIGDSPIRASGTNVAIDISVSPSYKLRVNGDTDIIGRIDATSSRISTMSSGLSSDLVLQRDGVTAATIKAGAIATLTGATPAATNGQYSQLALTGGTGTGATADIFVASGVVAGVTLRAPGNGYTVGDLLTCPTLTGLGVGVTVATVATVIADVEGTANITASGRLGAFTANPRAGLDVASGSAMISGATRSTFPSNGGTPSAEMILAIHGTVNPTASNYALWLVPQYDLTAGTINNPTLRGIECNPSISASSAGTTQSVSVTGANITAQRWSASDLSTISTSFISAVRGTATIGASTGAASTASVQCFNGLYQVSQAGHTVTNGFVYTGRVQNTGTTTTLSLYGIDTATFSNSGTIGTLYGLRLPTITNTGTITTRYGISQEDTAAINVLASATRVGATTAPATNTLDVSTAGWGVKLPSAPGATGAGTENTLDCYAEGNWTPTDASGAGMTLTQTGGVTARYTQIGRQVVCFCDITYPAAILGGASAAAISLPVSAVTAQGGHFIGGGSTALWGIVSGANLLLYNFNTLTATTNTTIGASRRLIFTLSYFVS